MLQAVQSLVAHGDPWADQKLFAKAFQAAPGEHAGKSALDIAIF